MQILGIESSTKYLSVSLSRAEDQISSMLLKSSRGFMSNIISVIDKVLKKGHCELSGVDFFAVNTGPGDFTGTRIGLSVAKILALVEKKPVFAVSCPDVFAASILENNKAGIMLSLLKGGSALAVPVIDVKRDELYFSVYEATFSDYGQPASVCRVKIKDSSIYMRKVTADFLADYESFSQKLEEVLLSGSLILSGPAQTAIYCGGTAFDSYGHLATDIKKLGYNFIVSRKTIFPHAAYINKCAAFRAGRGQTGGDKNIAPLYVREFVPFK